SYSILSLFESFLRMHKHLFAPSNLPVFVICFFGFLVLFFDIRGRYIELPKWYLGLLRASFVPIGAMVFLGSREYFIYIVSWFPYLALLFPIGVSYFSKKPSPLRAGYAVLVFFVLMMPPLNVVRLLGEKDLIRYAFDGTENVAAFLKENMDPNSTIYVIGYRLDLYVRVGALSFYPFANWIMVHPDRQIRGAARKFHVYPKYERLFLRLINQRKPDYMVVFRNSDMPRLTSKVSEVFNTIIETNYSPVFALSRKNPLGRTVSYRVYKKDSKRKSHQNG
ncbi:MAG: hypothetical protein D6808_05435, partial [Candidatus Dadabacteria bacterium]